MNYLRKTTLQIYGLLLHSVHYQANISWCLVSESSNIRGFQYIKMYLSKLLDTELAVKTSNFKDFV